jgi:hypothetical protein
MLTRTKKHLLEQHHAAGFHNDEELTVVLCQNHHTKLTASQLDAGALSQDPAPSVIEHLMQALKSLGLYFEDLAAACYRFANQLIVVVATLDQYLPLWRTLPGMS